MKKMLSLVFVVALLAGCGQVAKNLDTPIGDIKQGQNGMRYVLTCVEGYRFIATQTAYEYWNLAGPIGKCDNT